LFLCFWVACGVATFTEGVSFAVTEGIVVSVATNVGEGAGAVGVGERLPGGVLVGFTVDVVADRKCGVLVCAFAIPSTEPMQEKSRSKKEQTAISA
jgi:hypothetical protein